MVYQESGLSFRFDSSWQVKAYDKHRFYQGLSGAGLSGVDFIGLRRGQLYFFEVKNYRRRQDWQQLNPFDEIAKTPTLLSGAMAKKVEDTLLGLDAIGQYYQRKWLFRQLMPLLLTRIPPSREWAFWARAYTLSKLEQQPTSVLWLETEQPQLELRAELTRQIKALLPGRTCLMGNGENGLPGVEVE